MTNLRGFLFVGLAAAMFCGLNAVAMADLALIETEAVSPSPTANNLYGCSVSLDGNYLAVGSNYQLDDVNPGKVEIFLRNPDGSLTHQQTLTGFSGDEDFGTDVSLSGDTLAVGAHNSNSAYIYTRSGSTWSLQQTVTGGYQFGISVSVSDDNLIVGEYRAHKISAFHRDAGVWSLESEIVKPNTRLAYGVGLCGDVAIAGPWGADSYTGSVSMFRRTWDDGTQAYIWNEDGTYQASDAATNAWFGYRSDVYVDEVFGDVAIVSAKMDDEMGSDAGAAYIFRYDSGSQTWVEQAKLLADDIAPGDTFGTDVAIYGNTAICGSRQDDDNGDNSGSAYIFQWDGETYDAGKEVWVQVDKLTASDGAEGEMFGEGVAIDGEVFAVGAWGYSTGGESNLVGSAYVYATTGGGPLAGDLNDDGFVGGDDLDIVRSFWGQNVTAGDLLSGDPSNDGFVGGDDLDIVRANWGQGTPPAPTAIPEPTLLILLMAGAGTVLMRRSRGKNR